MVNLFSGAANAVAGTYATAALAMQAAPVSITWAQDPFGQRWFGFTGTPPALTAGTTDLAPYITAAAWRIEQA